MRKQLILLLAASALEGMGLCGGLAENDPLTTGRGKWVSTAPLLAPVERTNDPCFAEGLLAKLEPVRLSPGVPE